MDDIVVQHSDTQGTPFGYGSYGSRTSNVGTGAALKAAAKIRDKARRYAAHMLEANVEDIEVDGAEYRVKGSPEKKKTIQEIAFALDLAFDTPEGMEPYLDETAYYDTPNCTFPFGTHIAIVEIDEETGEVDLVRYIAVDDVGKKINPMIVDGQLHGGIAQGVGQALWEEAVYSDDGQLLSGSMLDYALPRASWLPSFELDETVTPSPGQPARRQGRRRGRLHREHRGGGQRGHRRAQPARHPAPRHAVHRAEGVGRHPEREGRPGMIPAAFGYTRAGEHRRGARPARRRRRREGHRGRPEPAPAAQAAPRQRRVAGRHRAARRAPRDRAARRRAPVRRRAHDVRGADGLAGDPLRAAGATPCRPSATSRSATAAPSAARSPTPTRRRTSRPCCSRSTRSSCSSRRAGRGPSRPTASSRGRSRPAMRHDELLTAHPAAGPARQRGIRVCLARAAGLGLRDGRRGGGDRRRSRRRHRARRDRRDRRRRPPVPGERRRGRRSPARRARPRTSPRRPPRPSASREVNGDIHASAEYRSAMAAVYTRRAIEAALARVG